MAKMIPTVLVPRAVSHRLRPPHVLLTPLRFCTRKPLGAMGPSSSRA